jgi:hypothetical protein
MADESNTSTTDHHAGAPQADGELTGPVRLSFLVPRSRPPDLNFRLAYRVPRSP